MDVANLVSGLWSRLYLKNEQMELTDFFLCCHKLTQIERWLKILWVKMVKDESGQFDDRTL